MMLYLPFGRKTRRISCLRNSLPTLLNSSGGKEVKQPIILSVLLSLDLVLLTVCLIPLFDGNERKMQM
jgi:hypothetical protein